MGHEERSPPCPIRTISRDVAAVCCWTSPRRPAKSPAWSTKPTTYTSPSSQASVPAATPGPLGRLARRGDPARARPRVYLANHQRPRHPAGPLGVRGRGSSGCEDNDRRYDLYQGQGGKKGDTYLGRRGGAWSPTRGRAGRTSLATPSTYLRPVSCGPRHRSPPRHRSFTKCFLSFSKHSAPPWYCSVRQVGGPRPPLDAPTNHRAGHRPWTELDRASSPAPVTAPEAMVSPPGPWPAQR